MKVFVSHSSLDKSFVYALDEALNAYGVDTFLDERDILIGESIPERIYNEIEKATHICYILSNNSVKSNWVKDELSVAHMLEKERSGIFILPILIEDVAIPVDIKSRRYVDFRNIESHLLSDSTPFEQLLKSLGLSKASMQIKEVLLTVESFRQFILWSLELHKQSIHISEHLKEFEEMILSGESSGTILFRGSCLIEDLEKVTKSNVWQQYMQSVKQLIDNHALPHYMNYKAMDILHWCESSKSIAQRCVPEIAKLISKPSDSVIEYIHGHLNLRFSSGTFSLLARHLLHLLQAVVYFRRFDNE